MIVNELEKSRILTYNPTGEVEIIKRGHGRNIQFIWEGDLVGCRVEEVVGLLNEYKIRSALVRIRGKVSLNMVEDAIFGNSVYRPTIVIANKNDMNNDPTIIGKIRESVAPHELLVISVEKTQALREIIGKKIFQTLEITRIYTKEQGNKPSKDPIVNHGVLSVGDLAKIIHNDFYDNFKYARIWGASAKFPKEKVGLDRELKDGTVIQIVTK
jgi:ribosome-interacting GTPase 1